MRERDRDRILKNLMPKDVPTQIEFVGETLSDLCDAMNVLDPAHPDVELARDYFNRGIQVLLRFARRHP